MKTRAGGSQWRYMIAVLVTVVLIWLAWAITGSIEKRMDSQAIEFLRKQVTRVAVTCYSCEGRFPHDLSYLEDEYGLIYDKDKYLIVYDAFASNVMPQIRVLVEGEGMK